MSFTIVIGLPAYNEEGNIGRLLDRIVALEATYKDHPIRVHAVNDGSSDHTREILQDYKTRYSFIDFTNHPRNLGLGEGMNTILNMAATQYDDEDVLVVMDADNTHGPEIIPAMIEKLGKESLDIVIASRFAEGGQEMGLSLMRKVYSRGARLFCNMAFPVSNVTDYSCGYRAYRVAYLKKAIAAFGGKLVTSSGFECMVEIIARCSKIGVQAGEYPLILEYNLKEGASKMNVQKTIRGYFRVAHIVQTPK